MNFEMATATDNGFFWSPATPTFTSGPVGLSQGSKLGGGCVETFHPRLAPRALLLCSCVVSL